MMRESIADRIFSLAGEAEFMKAAIEIFMRQASENEIYREFLSCLGRDPASVRNTLDIPFLPVEFFRNHIVITGPGTPEIVFESSGTTAMVKSRHYVTDLSLYNESLLRGFDLFYGSPSHYLIAALMPSPEERPSGSLSYMVNHLIRSGADKRSGFFTRNYDHLAGILGDAVREGKKCILMGISYALLDFAEAKPMDLTEVIVVETGGMKGRREEITRGELHSRLMNNLGVRTIHSEYGMTELLSQAWSDGEGLFRCPPWMKILVRELNDPFSVSSEPGQAGALNIIDLANINSCSFIATWDLGRLHENGSFEVLGRYDHSDVRGCNLLAG